MKREEIVINVDDVIGKRLGKLKVISYAGCKVQTSGGHRKIRHYYLVECDCGNINTIRRCQVMSGKTRSCGCSKKKRGGYNGN